MLDIKFIRQNPGEVKEAMKNRNADVDVDEILKLDKHNREVLQELEAARAEQNRSSGASKTPEEIEQLKLLKEKIKSLEDKQADLEESLKRNLAMFPNIPLTDTPIGKDEKDNVVVREVGKKPDFKFKPKSYLEIGEKLGIIDTGTAGKVSGSRFGYLKGGAARLEFALVQLVMENLCDESFVKKIIRENKLNLPVKPFLPVVPPVMIKPEMMAGMGYLERGQDEIYYLDKDQLYLVGTSEQSIGPMHADQILNSKDLPLRYIGFSTCFRREAGSYGKDTKGILRVHQFDKCEMFIVCAPETSQEEHKLLLAMEESLMQKLEIPYQVVRLCTGDIGAPSAGTFDIEAWLPGQDEYRETHSTSNTTDYQARRLNSRYRGDGGLYLTHMLNGTAFAIGRIIVAIIENYQTEKGTVIVPKILRGYMGGIKEIT